MTDDPGRAPRRGAGRGGGVLFLALAAFVAYLLVVETSGTARLILALLLVLGLAVLALSVLRRR